MCIRDSLGSSFAYLGGFTIVTNGGANPENLPYACAAVALSGLVYVLFSALISAFGIRKMMRFFPPVVTGPIIIAIGLILAPSAISNCQSNWLLAFVALATVIVCNIWGKGMVKILPLSLIHIFTCRSCPALPCSWRAAASSRSATPSATPT